MSIRTDVEKFVRFCESDFGKSVLEKEADYIRRELKDCQRILDIGCGIGSFEQGLEDLNIIGLDSSEEMLKEAKKRSNKAFVLGEAENLSFGGSAFDAIFYVTTLEFVKDYQKAVQEAYRVTEREGKLLAMLLNPRSEYFRKHMQKEGSYFRKVKHTNLVEIRNYVSGFYDIKRKEYFLGIKGEQIFDTSDKRFASLYVLVGKKRISQQIKQMKRSTD